MNATPYARQNLFAFDATTGVVSQTFNPTLDGEVQQLLPGPTADTVYVAGDFTKINGKGPIHLQLINVNTGQAVTPFQAPTTNGGIETMELMPENRLFIGGFFNRIGGVTHGQLATLNATTGARTRAGSAARWPTPAPLCPAGSYAGLTATADGASSNATVLTVLLRQAG